MIRFLIRDVTQFASLSQYLWLYCINSRWLFLMKKLTFCQDYSAHYRTLNHSYHVGASSQHVGATLLVCNVSSTYSNHIW